MNISFINQNNELEFEYIYKKCPSLLNPYFKDMTTEIFSNIQNNSDHITFHSSTYKVHYMSANLLINNYPFGTVFAGPFLSEEPSAAMIDMVLLKNKLPVSLKNILTQYYLSLPLLNEYRASANATFLYYVTLNYYSFSNIDIKMKYIEHDIVEHTITKEILKKNTETALKTVEHRYAVENICLHAVTTGNKELLKKNINDYHLYLNIADRVPNNPLRSYKNMTFVLNTLLRKAAETGGVHPIYIDTISEKFAIQIESCTSLQQVLNLRTTMFFEYCDLVISFSLNQYSIAIQKAINYIRSNFNQELSLKLLADYAHICVSELSTRFNKETGQTIAGFINQTRIKEATRILENPQISVTDAAYMVGYNDSSYFSKIFKKYNGITPSAYKKSNSFL